MFACERKSLVDFFFLLPACFTELDVHFAGLCIARMFVNRLSDYKCDAALNACVSRIVVCFAAVGERRRSSV
jgi:hypothetical protein